MNRRFHWIEAKAQPLTAYQAAAIGAFTGIPFGPFSDLHAYAERKLGRPILTHQFPEIADELRQAASEDCIAIVSGRSVRMKTRITTILLSIPVLFIAPRADFADFWQGLGFSVVVVMVLYFCHIFAFRRGASEAFKAMMDTARRQKGEGK